MNKVLKMDFKGQLAVLSAFVLVGIMFIAPAITEKALAVIYATAKGVCGVNSACEFTLVSKTLVKGKWTSEPTQSGTVVTWETAGSPAPGDEKGSVTYKVTYPGEEREGGQGETAVLYFKNPLIGGNECSISGIGGGCSIGDPTAYNAHFTYNLRGKHG